MESKTNRDYITKQEAETFRKLLRQYWKSYQTKKESMSDKEWMEHLFCTELPEITKEEANQMAAAIMDSITIYDNNLESINSAAQKGISKERWLSEKIQEGSVGMAVNEYGQTLQAMDDILYKKNIELAEALQRSSDGHIKMSPNLDGNIAENMIAKTTELSGFVQGKNIKVEVRDVFTENSVDVRAINLDTGNYQNYQLKFGKDAQSTIHLIERGNYNNQRIIVPSEQLKDVQEYFKAKGSSKNISDHIEAWGAKGESFTKQDMKKLQIAAQKQEQMPSMDYNYYQTKDLAISIGKNAGVMALQTAAVTTGLTIANQIFQGETVEPDEMVEIAIKTGTDTSIKVISAGTLQIAIRKGIISFIPKATPAGIIANIACVGIENIKVLTKIATGELSTTKGLDQIGRITTSMIGGLWGMAKGAVIGTQLIGWIPVIGAPLAIASGFVGGMVGYLGGSKLGDTVYNTGKKIATVAKNVARSAFNGIKSIGQSISNGISSFTRQLFS